MTAQSPRLPVRIVPEPPFHSPQKLKFVGVDDDEDEEASPALEDQPSRPQEDPPAPVPSTSEEAPQKEGETEEEEIREAAEKVVEEVITKAQDQLAKAELDFPVRWSYELVFVRGEKVNLKLYISYRVAC